MDDFIKAAVAAGASVIAAKALYKKYQENKIKKKFGMKTKSFDDYLPPDVRMTVVDDLSSLKR